MSKRTYNASRHGSAGDFGWAQCQGNTQYAQASIGVTDADGNVVAMYRRQAAYGGATVVAFYTSHNGNRHHMPSKPPGEYRWGAHTLSDGSTRPATGTYKNMRAAFCAVVKALYDVDVS